MKQRRIQNYQQQFFNELQKSILQKKILAQFIKNKALESKRQIWLHLKLNLLQKAQHKSFISAHIDEQNEEQNHDLLQIAYNCLKEHVVLSRGNGIGSYGGDYVRGRYGVVDLSRVRITFTRLSKRSFAAQIQKNIEEALTRANPIRC